MSAWTIYWFTRLDTIGLVSCALAVFSSVAFIIGYTAISMWGESEYKQEQKIVKGWKKVMPFIITIVSISWVLTIFLPSSKEFAAIYLIPKIVNNEKVQQLPDKGIDLLSAKLDKWLAEMKEEKKTK